MGWLVFLCGCLKWIEKGCNHNVFAEMSLLTVSQGREETPATASVQ